MTRAAKIITHIVTGPTATSGKRCIISRHASEEAARKALGLAKGHPDYRMQTLQEFFA